MFTLPWPRRGLPESLAILCVFIYATRWTEELLLQRPLIMMSIVRRKYSGLESEATGLERGANLLCVESVLGNGKAGRPTGPYPGKS